MVSQNEANLEGFDEFGTSETFPPIPDTYFVASTRKTNASQQGGSNGKGNKRKRKMDDIPSPYNSSFIQH
ncbi:hypothetical protein LIER_32310 [Lithospermum erythrorhizon]|uniref:Uncharacterized protein n=1 Tax=Lithospermum erythrorhizon TaxID=34254 RepID=A0AAV3RXD1_LITER